MRVRGTGGKIFVFGSLLALTVPLFSSVASAQHRQSSHPFPTAARGPAYPVTAHGAPTRLAALHGGAHLNGGMKSKRRLLARRGFGLQCVTFARSESGIELSGNAVDWWENAAGTYQRGSRPELGSVLNFRANSRMHLGHVAVVTNVVDSRQIDIDQANWPGPGLYRGGVARDIRVVDVSPNNDWTAVRVGLGHSADFGSVYPAYGFIYARADRGPVVTASIVPPAAIPPMNPAPSDLRQSPSRSPHMLASGQSVEFDEVAEAPEPRPTLRRWHPRHR